MTDLIAEDLSSLAGLASPEAHPAADLIRREPFARLPRAHLSGDGTRGLTANATYVHAPAGFGKSCLLDQWQGEFEETGLPVLRIDVRATGALISYGRSGRKDLRSHRDIAAVLTNWRARALRGIALIDNGHVLPADTQQEILDLFREGDHLSHRLAIAARHLPDIPLSRAKALGQIACLTAEDLSFTSGEVDALLSQQAATTLPQDQINTVIDLTEGWPLALNLCLSHLAKEHDDTSPSITAPLDLIHDFLCEEVIQPQLPQVQDFLHRTAFLPAIRADLCNAIFAASDSTARIKDLTRRGLLIGPQSDGYRYPKLLARSLRLLARQERPDQTLTTAAQATDWFETHNLMREAFDQAAEIEDWHRAARIFDQHCSSAYADGRGQQLASMALRIPRSVMEHYPRVMVYAARVSSLRWRFNVVETLLRQVGELIRTNRLNNGDPDEFNRLMLHCRMLLAQFEDDQGDAERICIELLQHCNQFDPHTRGTIYGSLLYARRELFKLTDVADLEAAGLREFNRSGSQFSMVLHLCIAGTVRIITGDTTGALRLLREAMRVATLVETDRQIIAFPATLLAEIHYERNDIDESRTLLDRHFPSMQMGFVDQYVAAYVTDARLKHAAGDRAAAHKRLDEGLALAEAHALERLRHHVIAERIRLLMEEGESKDALRLGKQEGLLGSSSEMMPLPGCSSRDEIRAKSWVRLATLRQAGAEAQRVARRWLKFTADADALQASIKWEILLAHCQAASGDNVQAQRTLRAAATRALPDICMRSFLDEGPAVRDLLRRQLEASHIKAGATDRFIAELLAQPALVAEAAPPKAHPSSQDLLSEREIDILRMASGGMKNSEIAKRIGLTEGSVKWYLQQIYDRIGVRRRAGAIERARELGLVR